MAAFKGDDRAADGIPVEVKLDNGGYFEAFLMDITNGEALIHFPCGWMPEKKYQFSHVRFPPAEVTPRSALQEKMIAEVLVNKNNGFHKGWFKCSIQMLKSDFCQFEYLDSQNGSDFGHSCNMRKPNINPKLSMDMLHVHKIIIPADLRDYAKCENAHKTLKYAMKSALVNYDADRGELVVISRNIADISRAKIVETAYLKSLSKKTRYLQVRGKLNRNLEIAKNDKFAAEFTVPKSYLELVIGNGKEHLRAAQNIKGISTVQLIRKTNKFLIHGETEEAVKEARELLEIKIEPYPVLEEHMSQLVGRDSANIHKIIRATGAAEIYVEHIKEALERKEDTKNLPVYIIGTTRTIEKAKLFIQFQVKHIYGVQRLREKKIEINTQIAEFVRSDTTPESVSSRYSETVQSRRQIVPSTDLPSYNLVELEELRNLNELLSEDFEEAADLDVILENMKITDINLEDNTRDTNLGDNTTDIILENTTTTDINLADTSEDLDLGDNITRLNVSIESNEDSSKILDTPITIFNMDNLPGLKETERVKEVETNGFQFVEDPDFWTRDDTPSKSLLETQDTTCKDLINGQVIEELDQVISEDVTYTEQIHDVKKTQEIHMQEENLYLEANSSTPKLYNGVENLTKEPIVTPRLSLLRKSKKFRNASTETDDIFLYSSPSSSQEKSISSKSESSSFCDSNISIKIGTTIFSGYLKDVHETSSQEEYIESQCDDQEPDYSLPVDDAPKDLDCTDVSEDMSFEGQDSTIPLKDDKDSFY